MKRMSRIISTALATVALAAVAVPVAATAAQHAGSSVGPASVAAIGWPGDDAKPAHHAASAIGWPGDDATPHHKSV